MTKLAAEIADRIASEQEIYGAPITRSHMETILETIVGKYEHLLNRAYREMYYINCAETLELCHTSELTQCLKAMEEAGAEFLGEADTEPTNAETTNHTGPEREAQ